MIRKECISILAACLLGISSLTAFAAAPVIPQMPDRIIRAENAKEGLNAPSSEKDLVLLTWAENPESVRYEVEIFRGIPYNLDRNEPLADHVYDNQRIYTNKVIIDLSKIPAGDGVLYWRVRPIDADWTGLAPFSAPMEVRSTMKRLGRDAPLPNVYRPENGSSLLYPVYSYAGIPGAAKYEVEVTDSYPETLSGTAPSAHRVFSRVTSLSNVYDSDPRIGTYHWRVRGMDETGAPVGEWSLPERVRNDVESRYNVGIFGDSITQGGGHLYHSPADMAYSYVSYLDFPAVNMGRSGDTVEMMYDRFDRDVLPFHVKYLLIMGGINDLRMGTSPDKAIEYLEKIRQKCIDHGITPILMTIVPLNPENIQKYYGETTYAGWKESVAKVNAYIRTKPYIDTAAPFASFDVMPSEFAMDGIHGDWNAKQMIAGEINREIGHFIPTY